MTIPRPTYRAPARWLHWSMAILILMMIPAGIVMVQDGISRSLQNGLFLFHKNVGVLLLVMAAVRLFYRWRSPPPPIPAHLPAWQARFASATHNILYTLIFVMPISGYIRVKAGGFPIETLDALGLPSLVPRSADLADLAKAVHFYGGRIMIGIVALHIGAAFYHAAIKRDGVFARMWPASG